MVQAEAVERQAITAAEASQLDIGSMVQSLQAVVTRYEAQAAAAATAAAAEVGPARPDAALAELAAEELAERLAIVQAEHLALAEQQQEQLGWVQVLAAQRAVCLEVERQESLARLEVAAEQAADMAALAGRLAAVGGQLAEAQAAAQASREQVASLEEALEERELTVSQLERALEAVRDAQVASDAAGQQRELGRAEGEQRAAILVEQRAAWSTLQEIARVSQAGQMQLGRTPLASLCCPTPSYFSAAIPLPGHGSTAILPSPFFHVCHFFHSLPALPVQCAV